MTLAVKPRWRVGPELVEIFRRVDHSRPGLLKGLKSGAWANAVAAVEIALETYGNGRSELPGPQDVLSLFLGGRLFTTLDYLLAAKVPIDDQLEELKQGVREGEHQAWHAESHLFVLAQLHRKVAGRLPVRTIGRIKGTPTPDIAVDRIGLDVTIRPPTAPLLSDDDILTRLRSGIRHAAEKAVGEFQRVLAYVDFGPLDVSTDGSVARRIAQRRPHFEGPIAQMLDEEARVAGVVLATTLFDFAPERSEAATPAFRSAVHLRRLRPLPRKVAEPLLDVFDRR